MTTTRALSLDGPLLDVQGLSVTYGTGADAVRAAQDISFTVSAGERVALVGESGSGKTATCLAIAGFQTGGRTLVSARGLRFDGRDLDRTTRHRIPAATPGLAMVFQDAMTSLDPVWTVGQQLRAVLKPGLKGAKRAEVLDRARSWLVRVGLHDTARVMGSRPYELSGGMRQRVMLALALCGSPRLLVADEPTSALDASLSRDMMTLLVQLTEELGTALLIVSHDLHLCQAYADRTLVMYGGRIVEQAPSADLERRAAHPYTAGLLASVPTLESANLALLPTIATALGTPHGIEGCAFRPRCPKAVAQCETLPEPITIGPGHDALCWRPEVAPAAGQRLLPIDELSVAGM
jgi:peptide/nickel transport system ATP-binding protein